MAPSRYDSRSEGASVHEKWQKKALWEKKSVGWVSPIFFSIFVFRFSILSMVVDFRFSTFDFVLRFSILISDLDFKLPFSTSSTSNTLDE